MYHYVFRSATCGHWIPHPRQQIPFSSFLGASGDLVTIFGHSSGWKVSTVLFLPYHSSDISTIIISCQTRPCFSQHLHILTHNLESVGCISSLGSLKMCCCCCFPLLLTLSDEAGLPWVQIYG